MGKYSLCGRDQAGHENWNLYCAAWAEHDFDSQLERALKLRGKPEPVEGWAQRLADDVKDLTD